MKRLLDWAGAIFLLLLLSPLLVVLALLIRRDLGAGVIFRQPRPGLNGRPFTLYKFRTMTEERDAAGNLRPDGQRLTKLGRRLRGASLDELPQLYNVLKGEMSMVGPRPLYMKYLAYYTEQERTRHAVKPGITGWAQIHGRNFLPWDERLALDVWYAEHRSILLDLRIVATTFWQVIHRQGVAPDPDEAEQDLDEERRELSCERPRESSQPETGWAYGTRGQKA